MRRAVTGVTGLVLLAGGWAALWGGESYWNPLAFASLWTGAALLFWTAAGRYPGVTSHLALAALSVPFWWYFELVNERVQNWEYLGVERYGPLAYALLSSAAFATVVPAVVAVATLTCRLASQDRRRGGGPPTRHVAPWLFGGGLAAELAVLAAPVQLYPLVWIAPFLALDGLVAALGGPAFSVELARGPRRRLLSIALAGLICGALWEFWNYWAWPKWTYHVPGVGFARIFEMPLLGYAGYVPFAWSLTQAVSASKLLGRRLRSRAPGFADGPPALP